MKVVCVDNTGAALTVGTMYEARRPVNWFYLRVKDDNGHIGTYLEQRFRPFKGRNRKGGTR